MDVLVDIGYALLMAAVLTLLANVLYRCVNVGLSSSARHQQTSRLSIAAVLAVVPWGIAGFQPVTWVVALMSAVCAAWAVTYPLITYLTDRRTSPDIDNYMDIAFGLYMTGALSSLILTGGLPGSLLAAAVEVVMLMLIVSQWIYYFMYKGGVNTNGMRIIRDTNVNEVIEFVRYYPWYATLGVSLLIVSMVVGCVAVNVSDFREFAGFTWTTAGLMAYLTGVILFMFTGRRSPWRRCGLVEMYDRVTEYRRSNLRYKADAERRTANLKVRALNGDGVARPYTVLLVIGESATRDYMKAFNPLVDRDTTPWLTVGRADCNSGFIFFDNAYSCDMHTVQVLEKALTECNQYNGGQFSDSMSLIDMVRSLGFKVHWYSNQGHIGVFDTPVTLVAETSDVARWTRQEVGKVQYDGTLLDFLPELSPDVNNLLVLHLKGSHFSYLNRYPADACVWGEPGVQDNVLNYMNSLRYTDSVLKKAFDYCRSHLNLQAMVYVSDHGSVPERHRSPNFDGYGNTRIPLCVWASEEYSRAHADRFAALRANRDRYWTNDLLYELMLGVMDVEPSAHFIRTNSLAYGDYSYSKDDLRTFSNRLSVSDDCEPLPFRDCSPV